MGHITACSIRRRCHRVPLLGVLGLLLLPGSVTAQAAAVSDSSPFRKGQYGVEFGVGGFASLGLLRFSTPQRALLFDVQGFVDRGSVDAPGFPDDANTNYMISARAGRRRYRPVTSNVQRFTTLGVFGRSSRSTDFVRSRGVLPGMEPQIDAATIQSRANSGGLFGELGAAWMVNPRLSLGAAWGAELRYSRTSSTAEPLITGVGDNSRSAWVLSFGSVSVRGNLYF